MLDDDIYLEYRLLGPSPLGLLGTSEFRLRV